MREILDSKLFLGVAGDFDGFCRLLELPVEGGRFAADPDGYRRRGNDGSAVAQSAAVTSPSDGPDSTPSANKLTRPVAAPVGHLEPHALANLLPMASEEELQSLRENIRQHGLHDHICLLEGKILDGRNRYKACLLECVEPSFEEFIGAAPAQFVAARNLHRRNLTASQLAAIAVDILPSLEHEASERKQRLSGLRVNSGGKKTPAEVTESLPERGEAREAAAKATGANPRYVSDMAKIKREAPELHEQVKAGKLTVPQTLLEDIIFSQTCRTCRSAIESGNVRFLALAKLN